MNKQLSIAVSTKGISESSDEEWLQVLKKKKDLIECYKSWGTSIEDWRTSSEDQSTEEQLLMFHSSVVVVHHQTFVQVRSYKFWRTTSDDLFVRSCIPYQKFLVHQKFTAQSSTNQTRTSVVTFFITSCISLCICLCFRFTLPMLHTLIIV